MSSFNDVPFIEAQAILAAQDAPEELSGILDKFLPGELVKLMEAADHLGDMIRNRIYPSHVLEFQPLRDHGKT